ncbi:MAG TPA: CPBP family intramembrane glutamic endopeptidase [Rhizomicrobium sp.]|nr:CPBP family intramembrane glutamic endopeptidase [Rhizomicrobium sp.]
MPFQLYALLLTALWLAAVAIFFRTSRAVLIGGLVIVALCALGAFLHGDATPQDFGLGLPRSWLATLALAVVWLLLMLLYGPIADNIATRFFEKPPTLGAFRALQESRLKLVSGIVIAWVLGGFLEELVLRGIVLNAVEALARSSVTTWTAAGLGIAAAAGGAFIIHLYQGLRAATIVTQLSVLFGVLFVISGGNLWTVILCHGFYDTVAFIRFANKSSRYSHLDEA